MKKVIYSLQIMKNSPENCLAGKIFVHFCNFILWFTLIFVTFGVVFFPETPIKKFIGFLCLLGFFADYLFMSSVVPVLDNPFKKKIQAPAEVIEPEPMKDNVTEEFNQSVEKASRVDDTDSLDHSAFD